MRRHRFFIFAYWHDPRWKRFVGATVKIWDLAHNLAKLGHEVCLFLPKYDFDTSESRIKIIEIRFIDLPFLRLLSYNLFLAFYLIAFCLKLRPDVVYARRMGSIIPAVYASLVQALFFYEVNDDPYWRTFQEGAVITFWLRGTISQFQDNLNLRLCKRAFVVTREISKKIQVRNPRLPGEKLIEMPSGANTALFKPLPVKECRLRLNVDLDRKYVGFVGTLLRHQGVDVLIDSAQSILSREPSCGFLIVGEGPMKQSWMKAVEARRLGGSFIFPGQVEYEEVPTWINAMDICVAPFLKSAGLRSPVKIFDYMACGRPVVASRIDGTTDVFAPSVAITLVTPGSIQELADSIVDLLRDRKKAARMGKNARAFILAHYDRRSMARRICDEVTSCKDATRSR